MTNPTRCLSVVGARPQFVKAALVARALLARDGVGHEVLHTGQHYDADMSDVFFEELGLQRPAHSLGVGSGSHGAQTAEMLRGVEGVLQGRRPDWVIVYGDTNSTIAAALAAAKLHVRVAHVEAGLRSFNRRMPEEVNRVLTDHASDLLFAPTEAAVANLVREGIETDRIALVGDVMYDAARFYRSRMDATRLLDHGLEPGGYILATIHRAENTDDERRLRAIFEALSSIATELPVVVPLHPRTRDALDRNGLLEPLRRQCIVSGPVGYLGMLALESNARLIATDSGGVQKEAFFHRVPAVTLRDETEWVELTELGWNRLIPPTSTSAIVRGLREALACPKPAEPAAVPYGGGHAAEAIADRLLQR